MHMLGIHTTPEWDAVRAQLHHPDEIRRELDASFEKRFGYLGKPRESAEFKNGVTADLQFAARGVRGLFDQLEMDQLNHVRVGDIKAIMDEIADRADVPRVDFPAAQLTPHAYDEILGGGRLTEKEKINLSDDLRFIQRTLLDIRDTFKKADRERHTFNEHVAGHAIEVNETVLEQRTQERDEAEQRVTEEAVRARITRAANPVQQQPRTTTQNQTAASPTYAAGLQQPTDAGGRVSILTDMVVSTGMRMREAGAETRAEPRVEIINPLENPREFTLQFMRVYRELGLPSWSQPLDGVVEQIAQLSPEKKDFIKRELAEGCHAFLMPGKRVIKENLRQAIEHLKPVWYENGRVKDVVATYEWNYIQQLVTTKITHFL